MLQLVLFFLISISAAQNTSNIGNETELSVESASLLDWPMAGFDSHATRFQRKSKIGKRNAHSLRLAWNFETDPTVTDTSGVSATPTVANGYIYFPTWSDKLYCIRESDGTVVWKTDFPSRTSATLAGPLVIFGQRNAANVAAFDRFTGHLIWKTTIDPYKYATVTQSGLYREGVFYVGTSSFEELASGADPDFECCQFIGQMAAINAFTGRILWKTPTITAAGFYGAPIWGSSPAYLESTNYVFFTTGNNYKLPQDTIDCIDNLTRDQNTSQCNVPGNLVDSVVAVKASNGHIVWYRQLEGVDYYTDACWYDPNSCQVPMGPDYDFAQGPLLFQIKARWVLGAGSKSGVFYTLDAITGADVWRTAVGPGGGYGGIGWGSSVNDDYIFVPLINNELKIFTVLGQTYCGGGWAALDQVTGAIKWFTPASPVMSPSECATEEADDGHITTYPLAFGAISSTKEVMIGTSYVDGHIVVLDEHTGDILWQWQANVTIQGGVAVTQNSFYVGAGYGSPILYAEQSNQFYAFKI